MLTAAWTLAILSMAAVPPSIRYISYLDLHTLGLLFCLMATMAGLQAMGFFHQMGESLLMRIHSLRPVSYTHLDVYKRQYLQQGGPAAGST